MANGLDFNLAGTQLGGGGGTARAPSGQIGQRAYSHNNRFGGDS